MLLCADPPPAASVSYSMVPLHVVFVIGVWLPLVDSLRENVIVWLCAGISSTVSVCVASPPVPPALYFDPAHSRKRSWILVHVPPKSV